MRKIKFRAYHKDYGMCYDAEPFFDKREFYPFGICVGFSHYSENLDEWEIMQYTGLKDKNGKEIYEGDILQREGHNYKHIVKWWNESAGFNLSWVCECMLKGFNIEIIGNIHENPELLKVKAK
jgi:uncharacterized phage protein (TIGR01671 family)